ncbi:hypothetical protein DVH24_021415 [Malus domestica]|uniref:Histidinol-phosphatase n=1 Tax=Malus domestica TaxID=3750 RepID=A0A498K020_MALDO|nr:hypothetical protein DVH24_021415 [Malus domestica]
MLSHIPKPLSFSQTPPIPIPIPNLNTPALRFSTPKPSLSHLRLPLSRPPLRLAMASLSDLPDAVDSLPPNDFELDRFAQVANKVAEASGEVIRKYFRQKFDILDKEDSSPVTIADQTAEEAMVSIILENLPSHAIFGEENGWRCKEKFADYVWVLDPIDGTKSFITGKPVFGTLIALLHRGKPVRINCCNMRNKNRLLLYYYLKVKYYTYTTSPHLFSAEAEEAFIRVRNKVKVPLYGCDCYAYALLASGFVDLVVESGLKPYDFLSLIPVIEGAGGVITDWKGHRLSWDASPNSKATSYNVVAAGDKQIHQQALDSLQWQ